jgi:hypothetical protein
MDDRPLLFPLSAMARRLFVPARWLRTEAEAGRIPCLRAGSRFLFDPETVEQVVLERARKTAEVPHG